MYYMIYIIPIKETVVILNESWSIMTDTFFTPEDDYAALADIIFIK